MFRREIRGAISWTLFGFCFGRAGEAGAETTNTHLPLLPTPLPLVIIYLASIYIIGGIVALGMVLFAISCSHRIAGSLHHFCRQPLEEGPVGLNQSQYCCTWIYF